MSRGLLSAAAAAAALATGLGAGAAVAGSRVAEDATLRELAGQRLVVAMAGTTPSGALLGRVRRGEVGGVILFGGNVTDPAQVRGLTAALRSGARAGGRRAPLVLVDQEGGAVRRLRWLPPGQDAAALGRRSIPAVRRAGLQTAQGLRRAGIDVDLAPVADVPRVADSFLVTQRRAFSTDPARVASRSAAFARGLARGGVLAAAKHFPGLGGAAGNTDLVPVTIRGTSAEL
ncbi:MAG: glycoside hydrolase family 3 N-terminal domain-containing protein, partial [Gaiella sp.]